MFVGAGDFMFEAGYGGGGGNLDKRPRVVLSIFFKSFFLSHLSSTYFPEEQKAKTNEQTAIGVYLSFPLFVCSRCPLMLALI